MKSASLLYQTAIEWKGDIAGDDARGGEGGRRTEEGREEEEEKREGGSEDGVGESKRTHPPERRAFSLSE